MIKEILREICRYLEDVEHDKALMTLSWYYQDVFYEVERKDKINDVVPVCLHKEGSIWHYIKQGVYSYLAKKRKEQCKK